MGQSNGNFTLFNTLDKTEKQINTDKTLSLALFPDGKTLLKSSFDKNIEIYEYQVGNLPKLVNTLDQTNSSK